MRVANKTQGTRKYHDALLPAVLALAAGCGAPGATPSPATCYDPRVIVGDTGVWSGTIDTNPDHVFHCGHTSSERPSYIYQWKPLSTGTAVMDVHGRMGEDTIMDVLDANCYTPLACNDDYMGVSSRVVMDVQAGHTYTIAVGTFSTVSRAVDTTLTISVMAGASLDGGADGGADGGDGSHDSGVDASWGAPDVATAWDSGVFAPDSGVTPATDAGVDGSADGGPARVVCPGDPSFGCPAALTCSDGAGGAVSVPVGCGVAPSGARNVCAPIGSGGTGAMEQGVSCLGAQMNCNGPSGAVWQCPTRWLATDSSGAVIRVPNCCRWVATGAIPHGDCGVAMINGATICDAPPAGMTPER